MVWRKNNPSLTGTIKKLIVVVKSVFGEIKMDPAGGEGKGVGDRRLEGKHLSEAPHLTPPAWPFQLKAPLRAGIRKAWIAQIVEEKRASDHKKTNMLTR